MEKLEKLLEEKNNIDKEIRAIWEPLCLIEYDKLSDKQKIAMFDMGLSFWDLYGEAIGNGSAYLEARYKRYDLKVSPIKLKELIKLEILMTLDRYKELYW